MNTDKEEIAKILAEDVYYSSQVGGLVIYGAIEKLTKREEERAIDFAKWLYYESHIEVNRYGTSEYTMPVEKLYEIYLKTL